MASERPWTVLPHDPIEKLEENLWCADAATPMGKMRRRAMVVRFPSGKLAFLNAVPLEEPAQKELEAWGEPAFLVVPNGFHRLDIAAWKKRYPAAKVLAPDERRDRVEQKVSVDGGFDLLPAELERVKIDGLKLQEGIFVCSHSGGRKSLLIPGDLIFNIPRERGGLLLSLMGSSGGPKVTPLGRFLLVKDKPAVAASLRRLADTPGLTRVLVCHGEKIERDAAGVLRAVADRLSA